MKINKRIGLIGPAAIAAQGRMCFGGPGETAAVTGLMSLIGGVASGAGSGGTQTTVQGIELPPRFELDLIDQIDQNLYDIKQERNNLKEEYDLFTERMDIMQASADKLIPDDETIERLRDNALRLHEKIGGEAENLVDRGYLTQDEAQDLKQYRQLTMGEGQLQGEMLAAFDNQKASLLQEMEGQSPAVKAQALRMLETQFKQGTAQGLIGEMGMRSDLRQANFNQVNQAMGAVTNNMAMIGQGLQMQSGLLGQRTAGNEAFTRMNQANRQDNLQQYLTLGQHKFSSDTRGKIATGQIGQLGSGDAMAQVREGSSNMGSLYDQAMKQAEGKHIPSRGLQDDYVEIASFAGRNDLVERMAAGDSRAFTEAQDLWGNPHDRAYRRDDDIVAQWYDNRRKS